MGNEERAALEAKVFWGMKEVRAYYGLTEREATHLLNQKHCPHAKNVNSNGKHQKYKSYKVYAAQFREWAAGGFR